MIPYERQEKILEILENHGLIKIEELQEQIPSVSVSTLRRDLKELEKLNKVQMLMGGAVKGISTVSEIPIGTKSGLRTKEKELIANLAAEKINDGDTIYLDSGSTCTALLKRIIQKKITIVTSNVEIFNIFGDITAELIFLGGLYNPMIASVSGPLTDNNIINFNFDKSFLGANGVDAKKGVSTPRMAEASKKREVFLRSKTCYLLCDSSKFHQSSAINVFELSRITLISDSFDQALSEVTTIIAPKK